VHAKNGQWSERVEEVVKRQAAQRCTVLCISTTIRTTTKIICRRPGRTRFRTWRTRLHRHHMKRHNGVCRFRIHHLRCVASVKTTASRISGSPAMVGQTIQVSVTVDGAAQILLRRRNELMTRTVRLTAIIYGEDDDDVS